MSRFDLDPRSLSREVPIRIPGLTGDLEGLWRPARPGRRSRGVFVMCHPHPEHGGTMLNKVVFHTTRVLNHDHDLDTLRFNFRGTGGSAGTYDEGRGEVDDVIAAWEAAVARGRGGPLLAGGFSFGAAMSVLAAARNPAPTVRGLALLGLPLRLFELPDPFPQALPLAAVHGGEDQYTSAEQVERYLGSWPGPVDFHVVPGADHFLYEQLPEATGFLSRIVGRFLEPPSRA